MKGIAEKIRERTREYELHCLKHRYPKGIEFAITGEARQGYTLKARCLKRKKWWVLEHRVVKPSYEPRSVFPFLAFLRQAEGMIEQLKAYGVQASLDSKVA